MLVSYRRRLVLVLVTLALLGGRSAVAQGARAPEERAVRSYISFLGWSLGLRFTPAQEGELRAQIADYVRRNDTRALATVAQSEQLWQRVQGLEPAVRASAAAMARPDVLRGLRKAAANGETDSKWLVDTYYRANPPLAPAGRGDLPLTRDMVDAQVDLNHFMATEIHHRAVPAPDARAREAAAQMVARKWPTLTAEQQHEIAKQPGELAQLRGQWAIMGPELRLLVRASMGAQLSPDEQMMVQNFQRTGTMSGQSGWGMLQNQLASMQQHSEIIMGRGTVYNQTLGRWEQQGGIVTEYNGTVRVP